MQYRPWLVLMLCLLAAPQLLAEAPKPIRLPVDEPSIESLLRTDYYGIYLLGRKVGWARATFARTTEGKEPGYVSSMEMSARILAGGQRTEMQVLHSEEFDGKPPYALRGGRSRESDGKAVKEITLTRNAKGFDVLITAGGEKVQKQLATPDYTLADLTTPQLWVRQGPKPGEMVATRTFDFDDLKTSHELRKLRAVKNASVEGVKVTYYEVEVTLPKEGLTGLERHNARGDQVLSMTAAVVFEMRLEPERVAKDTQFSADLFELGKARVDQKLGDTDTITSLVLETTSKEDLGLKSGPRQTVTRNESGSYTLKLGAAHGTPLKATAEDIEEGLAETATLPISHPKVRALAEKAVGDAKEPREKVKRLVRFVSGYIVPSYTAQPMTLMDLLKVRKGDCSEFALLFTALARASGVPARELSGLVYMGDTDKAFGLHAWNEVVLDGHWVPVDASADEVSINATHVSFGSVRGEQFSTMLAALGKLSFKVVEIKRND